MQKKILIGICDIGMGHLNRQICIINELLKYDVDLLLTYTDNNKDILDKVFPNISKVKISIPWIACDKDGINFDKSLKIYKDDKIDFYENFMQFCLNVENYFDGKPDYVLTDYECNVAHYAYARDITLIGMEQHSKFLFMNTDDLNQVNDYSIVEESSRLKFFFPKVDYRIISSFFPIELIPNTLLLPPIFNIKKTKNKIEDFVLCYFSPYVKDKNFFNDIYNLIKNDKNNKYILYTKFDFPKCSNVVLKKFSNEFKEDLKKCKYLISTSGHQLISEAIFLEKPMYLIPIDTFEQHYSNLMVKKYSLGMDISDDYIDFINSIDKIKKNMIEFKNKYWKYSWKKLLNNYFIKDLKLKKR